MKLIITLSLVSFAFFASANAEFETNTSDFSTVEMIAGPGKKSRKSKRKNKKRKKACKQWGRRVYAG